MNTAFTSHRNTSFPEPYRIIFPLGVVFAIAGTELWVRFGLIPGTGYPGLLHARIMTGAFLMAFIAGFLMTAIPKMTASYPARKGEIAGAALLTAASGLSAYSSNSGVFYLLSLATLVFLAGFGVRRASARTKAIPPFFGFVATGMMCGMAGSTLLALDSFGVAALGGLGKLFLYQGLILSLVLGIGSRLIPVITGNAVAERSARRYFALALLVPGSLLVEYFLSPLVGGVLKALLASFVAFDLWKLAAGAKKPSKLAYGMRLAGLMVIAGLWLSALHSAFAVHWMHLVYVGGFGLMTFTVASRVTLAHGRYDLTYEAQSKALPVVGGLILLASVTRVFAPFYPPSYIPHLAYAAVVWIIAVLIWGLIFVRRMAVLGKGQEGC